MSSAAIEQQSTTMCSHNATSRVRCLTHYWIRSAIAGFLLSAGCTTATPPPITQRPAPGIPKPAAVDSPTTVNVYASVYTPGRLQYDLQIFSIARVVTGDTAHRTDSTHVTAILTITLTAGPTRNTVIARVQPDSVSVTPGSGTSVPIPRGDPLIFTIETQTGQVTSTSQEVARDCTKGDTDSSPIYGREVLPSIHTPMVHPWTDTVHTTICRGGVSLAITRIASYTQLQSPDSTSQLARVTQFRIAGSGRQWDQQIEVLGEGTSTDTLRLSGSPLRLREVTGSSQTKLSFRTQLRTQEFIQTSTTHLALRR